jgi:hypothetical protein
MCDRHLVVARVPDAVWLEERFEVLPCTVAPDCDTCDATDKGTIEFLCFTPDPESARAQFGDVCLRLGVDAYDVEVRAA